MQSSSDGHALLEALLHLVAGERGLEVIGLFVFRAAEARQHDPLAIERDLEIVLELETPDDVDRFAVQARADDVLAVNREVVADDDATARPGWKAWNLIVLGEIPTDTERLEGRCDGRAGDDLRRNLPGRRQVSIHQRGGHVQHARVVVESECFLV